MPNPLASAAIQQFCATSIASITALVNHKKLSYPGSAFRCSHHLLKRLMSAQKVNKTGACVAIG